MKVKLPFMNYTVHMCLYAAIVRRTPLADPVTTRLPASSMKFTCARTSLKAKLVW